MADLAELVKDALSRAVENGYYQELAAMTPEQLAVDLADKDADIEDAVLTEDPEGVWFVTERLVPLARAWLDAHKEGRTT